ncbi:hypothetical protein PG995_007260 [Apiospora arundinis]|uniref:Uncharacterized protein n=1 Tax=Apiospora arundinis TaxID=335852 RepID=A0ABR2JHQ2_9PEZI
MENRHITITSRPFANSKARRAEKDVPDWKLSPKKNIGRDASNHNYRPSPACQPQQSPRQPARGSASGSRHSSRLRSPSLPSISEAHPRNYCRHNSEDGYPKTACPIVPLPSTPVISNNNSNSEAAAVQGLRDSNEALLELVTELIRMVPTPYPVHELIQRREEARGLADRATATIITASAVGAKRQCGYHNSREGPLLMEGFNEEEQIRKAKFVKGHQPRSKSSVF